MSCDDAGNDNVAQMLIDRLCQCVSKIPVNCFSIIFVTYDDIDYKMMNLGMFQKNAGSLCLSCFRAFFLWFYDLKILFHYQPTFIYSCIFSKFITISMLHNYLGTNYIIIGLRTDSSLNQIRKTS